MIVVALVVVMAVVALVVVAAALIGRDGADDGIATVGVVLAIVVIAVVVVAAGFVVGGGGGERDGDATPSAPVVVSGGGAAPLRPPQLVLTATSEGQLPRPLGAMGDIVDGEALVVGVAGLEPGSRATVHQCPTGASAPSACRAGLAFHVGPQGRASVLVDLEEVLEVGGGDDVDCTRDDCSVVVFGTSRLEAQTVFGEPAPPPVTLVADPVAVPPGGTLTVDGRPASVRDPRPPSPSADPTARLPSTAEHQLPACPPIPTVGRRPPSPSAPAGARGDPPAPWRWSSMAANRVPTLR